jgi:AP-4 complex subunit epsilon-1
MSGGHLSKEFFELVKAIGESKSKQEEDRIIMKEVAELKKKLPEKGMVGKKLKELLVRLIYVEMLGHDGSFGYIKAVELSASTNLLQKRVGYLTCSLVLSPDHELRFMLVNQLQRDMSSMNHLECWAALTALTKLVTTDMVPAVMGDVVKLLGHDVELVRKKAVMALHRFHQLDPPSIDHLQDKIRRCLCDKDPAVMGATLCLLYDLVYRATGGFEKQALEDGSGDDDGYGAGDGGASSGGGARAPARGPGSVKSYKDLIPSFVSILKQIIEHRLVREYDYHRMPAPWIQIQLLRILALLGHGDQAASEGMYEILNEVMRRADTGINVGYAVM